VSRRSRRPIVAAASSPALSSPPVAAAEVRADSWMNAVTGLGTSIDPLSRATVVPLRSQWTSTTLETLYYEDAIAAKIVDIIIDDAMRQSIGVELRPTNGEVPEDASERAANIMRRYRALKAEERVIEGARWGRLYGGGGIFMALGPESGDPSLPLTFAARPRILALTTFEREELVPARWYSDPLDPEYGHAATWNVYPKALTTSESQASMRTVHTSRLLKFEGLPASKQERMRQVGWSPSVLTRAIEAIRDAAQNWRSIGLILSQAHQAVFKLKNLVQMVSNGRSGELQRRMEITNLMRSISRAVIVDADMESFEYHSANLSGLDAIADKTFQWLAGVVGMPVTKLWGMSPGGMNATGESDTRGWYDTVQAYREGMLGPQIEVLIRLIAAELGDPTPGDWCLTWPSLWQMSPTEESNYRKSVAESDAIYISNGVLTPEEVAVARFGGGSFSADAPKIDLELRRAMNRVKGEPVESGTP